MSATARHGVDDMLAEARRRIVRYAPSSSLAAAGLAGLGFEHVGDVVGGFDAWQAAGLPVAAAPPQENGLPGLGGPEW